jgi:hypothetical protein
MADITVYVDGTTSGSAHAGGAHYATLSAALTAECTSYDLVSTLNGSVHIECANILDTAAAAVPSTCTTDATHYIRIFGKASDRTSSNTGKWSTGRYRLHRTSGNALTIAARYVRVEDIQVSVTDTSSTVRYGIITSPVAAGGSDIRIDGCVIVGDVASNTNAGSCAGISASDADATVTIRNCVIYNWINNTTLGVGILCSGSPTTVENCTVVGNGQYGIRRASGTVAVTNTYAGSNATEDFSGTITYTTCASADATVRTGVTASIAYSTANFVNVTASTADLHLVGGASATLLSGGTDLSGSFTTDIDGDTYSTWSIGADMYTVPSGGLSIPVAMHHYRHHC